MSSTVRSTSVTFFFASLLISSLSTVFASESDHKYQADESVTLWVNKVGPYNNPQETYNYYSLPFCHPSGQSGHKWGGLGEVLGAEKQPLGSSMGLCNCLAKCVSELILIGINCILALGGALVLYVGIYLRHTGWVDVIQGYWSPIDGIITALIVIGAIIIGLAVLGSIAALCRWRFGLCVYASIVLLFFIIFVIVAVAAFLLRHRANDWEDSTYPASSDEESVKENFDQAYCYAQGEFICNQASVSDALTMFVPTLDSSIVSLFDNMTGGVNALCDDYLGDYDQLSSVCDGCDQARQFKSFSSVVDWANDKCPRSSDLLIWCGVLLSTGSTSSSSGTAPYSECRTEFLNLVEKYALWLGIGSIIVCAGALMVITFACILRRRNSRPASPQMHAAYGRF